MIPVEKTFRNCLTPPIMRSLPPNFVEKTFANSPIVLALDIAIVQRTHKTLDNRGVSCM